MMEISIFIMRSPDKFVKEIRITGDEGRENLLKKFFL